MTGPAVGRALERASPRGVSAVLFTVAALLAALSELAGMDVLAQGAGLCLAGFVLIEVRAIGRPQRIAALLLLGVAVAVAVPAGRLAETLGQGILRTLPFLLIFASVGWLRAAAMQSGAVQRIGVLLPRLGAGRSFAALALAAHLIGSGFNLAGVALLAPMVDGAGRDAGDTKRLRCALLWGFAAAPCWSPFIVGTVAILAVFGGLRWSQVLPYGTALAVAFLLWAILWDRLTRPPGARGAARVRLGELAGPSLRLVVVITALFLLVLALTGVAGLSLPVAIALVAPGFALLWTRRSRGLRGVALAREVVTGYPAMRNEATLFAAANIFGVAVSRALSDGAPTWLASGMTGWLYLDALLMLWGFLAVSALGIHPVVSLVVFAALVDPSALGLPLPVLAAVMMACWGMGTSVSPLSGTTLLMAQLTGVSSFTIAWRWSGAFYAAACLWLALLITLAV